MDPEPNEETKVSAPVSATRQGGASDDPTSSPDTAAAADLVSDPGDQGRDGADSAEGASGSQDVNTPAPAPARKRSTRSRPKAGTHPNNVRRLRQRAMMSKAELARRAGVSAADHRSRGVGLSVSHGHQAQDSRSAGDSGRIGGRSVSRRRPRLTSNFLCLATTYRSALLRGDAKRRAYTHTPRGCALRSLRGAYTGRREVADE